MEKEDFLCRPYQQAISDIAYTRNTIIYLPTGSGKTFIAIMLLNRMSHKIVEQDSHYKSVFLVNTVPLVEQHVSTLKRHTAFEIGGFSGDMNVDLWSEDEWENELRKYQVIVLTAQIFLDIIRHGYFSLDKVNLLVFDECHQAVFDQPMRQLMQLFANVEAHKQPRVLGLTATLLNGNCMPNRVMDEVVKLETTFHSKVATVHDVAEVIGYSTKARESIVTFPTHNIYEELQTVGDLLERLSRILDDMKIQTDLHTPRDRMRLVDTLKEEHKKLGRKVNTLREHIHMCGIFGGAKAALATLVEVEHMKRRAENQSLSLVLSVMSTTLASVLRLLNSELEKFSVKDQIYKFSSKQILTLIETLREMKQRSDDQFCGIVFVNQRFTAKVLFYILKALAETDPDFSYLSPNFIVGYNAPSADRFSREMLYASKVNKRIIKSFQDRDLNLLVASSVLEEGIDIPACSLVIKFDRPQNYRSYIQSKGRARHENSNFIIMVPQAEHAKFKDKHSNFRQIERILQCYLTGKNEERSAPDLDSIQRQLYEDQDVPPYYVNGPGSAHVSALSAISLLNRYCQSLQRDKYSDLVPIWYLEEHSRSQVSVVIELPVSCPIRYPIKGPPMPNKVAAKRAAALEACKLLHAKGELNENLLPQTEDISTLKTDFLFVNWINEKTEHSASPGTKKFVRVHKKYVPEALIHDDPILDGVYYLHIIEMKPLFNVSASEYNLYIQSNLVSSDLGYGFVTRKPLPKICDFPIFVSAGELAVHVLVNYSTLQLTYEDILRLRKFTYFLYHELLDIVRCFLVCSNPPDTALVLLAPTLRRNGEYTVDMDMTSAKTVPVEEPSGQVKMNLNITDEAYLGGVVCPWYRDYDKQYVVSRVCYELNARSSFPSDEYTTYEDYYNRKHGITIVNPTQPLLLVKAISKRLNCILPRSVSLHGKRRKHDMEDGWEEHLVPEMCVLQTYPGALWYKAHLLPTIVHRISRLLQVEELRRAVASATGVGVLSLAEDEQWEALAVDVTALKKESKKVQQVPSRNVCAEDALPLPAPVAARHQKLSNKDYSSKMLERMYPWKDEQEPLDIERHIDSVTVMQIEDYECFCSNKELIGDEAARQASISRIHGPSLLALPADCQYRPQPIRLLSGAHAPLGPQLCKLLQATTAHQATDIVNLERLETLGDSLLKFAVSLFLLFRFPDYGEGILTSIKGKIIGNRNLLYCALARDIAGFIQATDFSETKEWIPPGFELPEVVRDKLTSKKISINKLYELEWPLDVVLTGFVDAVDVQDCEDEPLVYLGEAGSDFSSMDRFFGRQHLRDKTVSDSVEALIGAYLEANGVDGALSVVEWLGIIPRGEHATTLLARTPPSALVTPGASPRDVDFLIPNYRTLEEQLGYKFRDRSYLLQALTHASFSVNRLTDCYQRLEFLGDAVLDFLITCHIYERCGAMSPGELTDLRSALVNNITFASLAVRCGFHKHLKFINSKLMDIIDTFVRFQEERNFVINEDILILLEEDPMFLAEQVPVPKVLGDVFESLAGAVFLDSGMSLPKTWAVFHRLMWREIDVFMANVPKNPVRLLYECVQAAPEFKNPELLDNGRVLVSCAIMVNGKKVVCEGFGENKAHAKRAAAKLCLRLLT